MASYNGTGNNSTDSWNTSSNGQDITNNEAWQFILSRSNMYVNRDYNEEEMLTMGRHGSGHPDGPIGHSSAAFVTCSVIILLMVNLYLIYTIYYRKKYFSYYWIKKNGDSQLTLREPQEVDEDKDSSSEDDDEKESESQLDDDEASYKPNV